MEETDNSQNKSKKLTGKLTEMAEDNKKNIEINTARLNEIWVTFNKQFADLNKRFDESIGQIMNKLDEHGLNIKEMKSE